jgi:hypothetical protein
MASIRMWIIHKAGEDGKWIAFSDNYEWAYVAHHQDDFIKFLQEMLPAVERFEVEADGSTGKDLLYLKQEMFLHYSFQTDFLMEIKSNELPLGDVHHKFWIYNWGHNLSMTGNDTDTYTLKDTELELLNQDVNDLFFRGFFHQSSSKYFLTNEVDPQQSVWVFQDKDKRHFFTDQYYDQKAPIKDLTWYRFIGEALELNVLMLPGLNAFLFKDKPELRDFLLTHDCQVTEKSVLQAENRLTETGKATYHLKLENDEFLFINRSEKERYIDGQVFERGHYRRLFYMHEDSHVPPTLEQLLETEGDLIWHGNSSDIHAPDYVKSFVRLKHDVHEKEEKEGRNGCILISLAAAAILGLLIYWIFW